MSRPAAHRVAGQKRGLHPDYLNKEVRLVKWSHAGAATGPTGSTSSEDWAVDAMAHIRPYDAWIGVLSDQEGIESVPYEAVVVVRADQPAPADMDQFVSGDRVTYDGRHHKVNFVERGLYVDGVVLYVSGEGVDG